VVEHKPADFCVFIGRFAPFHFGHLHVVESALQRARHVIILCGSANRPPSLRNPWSFQQREAMIRSCFDQETQERLHIAPLQDHTYNDSAWVLGVQTTVMGFVEAYHQRPHQTPVIELIGHQKDHSSYYLKMFPHWRSFAVASKAGYDGTAIREFFFSPGARFTLQRQMGLAACTPGAVISLLEDFASTSFYADLCVEEEHRVAYKKSWAASPYTPTFVTTDALVVQAGHVLLIERKNAPGKGLWAMPGGFVGATERIYEACLRELYEETELDVPASALKGTLVNQRVFDAPHRSERGRTITHAFYFALDRAPKELPKVQGADDAKKAFWLPLSELDPKKCFEDHYCIIRAMLGI
jgi:bifunctional NMN adenylyltransferase/nudix hydrolase